MSYRDQILDAIDRALALPLPPAIDAVLARSQLGPFARSQVLVDHLRMRSPSWQHRDAALLVLLECSQAPATQWDALLLLAAAHQRTIDALYAKRVWMRLDSGFGEDWRDESWGIIFGAFQKAVARYPVARRRTAVGGKLEGLVFNELKTLADGDLRSRNARKNFRTLAKPLIGVESEVDDGARTGLWDFGRTVRENKQEAAPDELDLREAAGSLDKFLASEVIDDMDRRLLIAKYVEDRSVKQIAKAFRLTIGIINGRLARAKKRMQRYSAATPVRSRRRKPSHRRNLKCNAIQIEQEI